MNKNGPRDSIDPKLFWSTETSWFRLEDYEKVKSYNLIDWFQALQYRSLILKLYNLSPNRIDTSRELFFNFVSAASNQTNAINDPHEDSISDTELMKQLEEGYFYSIIPPVVTPTSSILFELIRATTQRIVDEKERAKFEKFVSSALSNSEKTSHETSSFENLSFEEIESQDALQKYS